MSFPVPSEARGAVTALGNFDGMHRGHRFLIGAARDNAAQRGKASAVLTFEPHPRRLFRPDDAPFRITPLPLKLEKLAETGIDHVFVLNFDWPMAQLGAGDFIATILKDRLGLDTLVIGNDFHFGVNRAGSAATLRDSGLSVIDRDLLKDATHTIYSATRIRGLLQAGRMTEANDLLGWDWEIRGTIVPGDKRGRELGYPTANMALGETIHPGYGIYASLVRIEGEDRWRMAASNIGIRPMFEAPVALSETFIFDFDSDIYGREFHLRPVAKLRGEAKFESIDALKIQMAKDCATARDILSGVKP